MKFPYLRALGPRDGWYRVGPLARLNTCDFIDTPEAETARRAFQEATGEGPCQITLAYHWARMIELLHSIEKIDELLHDPHVVELATAAPATLSVAGLVAAFIGIFWAINEYQAYQESIENIQTTYNSSIRIGSGKSWKK